MRDTFLLLLTGRDPLDWGTAKICLASLAYLQAGESRLLPIGWLPRQPTCTLLNLSLGQRHLEFGCSRKISPTHRSINSSHGYRTGIVPMSYRYTIDIVPVSHRYRAGIASVSYRYRTDIVPVSYRYRTGIVPISLRIEIVSK